MHFVQKVELSGFKPLLCNIKITLPEDAIAEFCQRWKVQEFYLFGSVLRNDFHSGSDIDVMVQFAPDAYWGFEIVAMKRELEELFSRKVDLLTKASIEASHNWIRRKEILETARLIYAAG
ncbi:MAG: nucleotidyltransferase domain-containing protein [Cyanobacteria bacterium P01_F01_bin.86]